jgi:CCR4-NOT complex subunit CAF16
MGLKDSMQGLEVSKLAFNYAESTKPLLSDLSFKVLPGEIALLVGANGTGKSTLLRILSGLHFVKTGKISLWGMDPFSSPSEEIVHVSDDFRLNLDLRVSELKDSLRSTALSQQLFKLLEIDLNWRMHQVSDGQRQRVQLWMALSRPWRVLFLDEVTVHLDVNVRNEFLDWVKKEVRKRKGVVFMATHIFDSLYDGEGLWFDQVLFLGKKTQWNFVTAQSFIKHLKQAGGLSHYFANCIRKNSISIGKN